MRAKGRALMLAGMVSIALMASAGCGLREGMGCAASRHEAVCREIAERYDAVLAGRTCTCVKNEDCACYGPASKKSGCGGIAERATVEKLRAIRDEFHRAGCLLSIRCAPWVCNPVCDAGVCVNGRSGALGAH